MGITQNASRVRIESPAKDGTLGAQGVLNADQILFDTAMTTNNGNTEASPTFQRRHVVLRAGEVDEELNIVQSIDVDGVTCTMQEDWLTAPVSGDAYEVAYRLDDVATIAGCDFETDSRQWAMTKRLVIGTATLNGFLGLSHGQVFRLHDNGPTTSALRGGATGRLAIGMIRNDRANLGATLIFMNDADNELVWDNLAGMWLRLYEFTLMAGRNPEGVNSLDVTVNAGADLEWARSQLYGIDAPFKKRVERLRDLQGVFYGTVAELKLAPWYTGHMQSENDQAIKEEIAAEPDDTEVRLLVEFV